MMHKKNIGNRVLLIISLCALLSVNINCSHETLEKKLINKEWELVAFRDSAKFIFSFGGSWLKTESTNNKYIFLGKNNQAIALWDKHSEDTFEQIECKWDLKDSTINLNFDLYGFYEFQKVKIPIRYKILELRDHTLELRNLDSYDSLNYCILMYKENNSMCNYINSIRK
jgi:hypothetical protein